MKKGSVKKEVISKVIESTTKIECGCCPCVGVCEKGCLCCCERCHLLTRDEALEEEFFDADHEVPIDGHVPTNNKPSSSDVYVEEVESGEAGLGELVVVFEDDESAMPVGLALARVWIPRKEDQHLYDPIRKDPWVPLSSECCRHRESQLNLDSELIVDRTKSRLLVIKMVRKDQVSAEELAGLFHRIKRRRLSLEMWESIGLFGQLLQHVSIGDYFPVEEIVHTPSEAHLDLGFLRLPSGYWAFCTNYHSSDHRYSICRVVVRDPLCLIIEGFAEDGGRVRLGGLRDIIVEPTQEDCNFLVKKGFPYVSDEIKVEEMVGFRNLFTILAPYF